MTDTVFFRLLAYKDRVAGLSEAVEKFRKNSVTSDTYAIDLATFQEVPDNPFAYWITPTLIRAFEKYEPLEGNAATVKVGLQTGDDFRYVRAFWEIDPQDITTSGKPPYRWVPHAKGGENLPFYADIHLLVKWHRNGEEIRNHPSARPQNSDFYFRSGITFPYRTFRLSPSALSEGCITGVTGMGIFPITLSPRTLLAVVNSEIINQFVSIWLGLLEINAFVPSRGHPARSFT